MSAKNFMVLISREFFDVALFNVSSRNNATAINIIPISVTVINIKCIDKRFIISLEQEKKKSLISNQIIMPPAINQPKLLIKYLSTPHPRKQNKPKTIICQGWLLWRWIV